jgi:hypothetical protein
MFKAEVSTIELQLEKGMAVKTVDRTSLQGQSAELFRAAIKTQATRDPYHRRIILSKYYVLNTKQSLISNNTAIKYESYVA